MKCPDDHDPPVIRAGHIEDAVRLLLPENDDHDPHEIGTDEFLKLCREVGAEPAITVRLSENSPDDAAAWVEYCNGAPDTPWGRIRAGRGQSAPYGVKCWFLGNELYAFGRGGLNGAETAARQTRLFASAMGRVDADIRLTGCTRFGGGDWNKQMIREAGEMLDLCSAHDYLLDHFKGDLPGIAGAPTKILRPILQNARASLGREIPSGRRFGIAFDEWNTRWGLPGSVGMGLYVAGVLNLLCREAGPFGIERACYFMPVNEGAIDVAPLEARLAAAGEVFELYKVHQGNRLLAIPEAPPDADLDLCASATPEGRGIHVTAVNRSIGGDRMVEFKLRNFTGPSELAATFLIPDSLDENARGFRRIQEGPRTIEGGRASVKIGPGPIARLRFGSQGPSE